MLKCDISIVYIQGKDLYIVDTLSRASLIDVPTEDELSDSLSSVTALDLTMNELKELQHHTASDDQLMVCVIQNGWPQDKNDCPNSLTPFWNYRDELLDCAQLVGKGRAVVILASLHAK